MKLRDIPVPEVGRGDILIRVRCCGVCHTDLHIVTGELVPHRLPVVPGHEVVGRIHKMGDRVEGLAIGQYVGLGWNSGFCDECASCRNGDHNLCADAQATIAADGRRVTYESNTAKQANLLLALDESETQSYRFELRGLDLAAGAVGSEASFGRTLVAADLFQPVSAGINPLLGLEVLPEEPSLEHVLRIGGRLAPASPEFWGE